jgi:hypothetical protein
MSTELERATEAGKIWLKLRVEIGEMLRKGTRHCTNCERFDDETEICRLYQARPPARVIVSGCDKHEDEIPF